MDTTLTPQATTANGTDRIERDILIQAPRGRVWQALADAPTFGQWFGVNLEGHRFEPGRQVIAPMTACGHDDVMFDAIFERIEPQALLSFRWHPHAMDTQCDYSQEERTLVTFTLADEAGGTRLRVVETGFDRVPPQRRMAAFQGNSRGWAFQLTQVQRHVESH